MALRTATPIVAVTAVATGLLLGGTAYAALNTTPSSSSSSTSQTARQLGDDHGGLRSGSAGAPAPGESGAAHDLSEAAAKAATGSDDALENGAGQTGTEEAGDDHQPATVPTPATSPTPTHGDDMRSSTANEHAQDLDKRRSAADSAQALHQDGTQNGTEDNAKGDDDAAEHSAAAEPGDDHGSTSGSEDEQTEQEHSGGHHGADD